MKRRTLLKQSAAMASSLLWAPHLFSQAKQPLSVQGKGHNAYFSQLNQQLKQSGPGHPVIIVDYNRLNHNIDQIVSSVGPEKSYRAVVKSLPSVQLLEHVITRAKSSRLMVFHQPFLNEIATHFPNSDALLGKPMPVTAARTFYNKLKRGNFNPATQVQWLIDSQQRLLQYQALARELGVHMTLNFEINVGLFRGGFESPQALSQALQVVKVDERLSLGGMMGYEPHLTGLKADLKHPAVQKVLSVYHGHIDAVKAAGFDPHNLTLNGAGSHTLPIYKNDKTMNDLSAGSGVVMPTDFDTHHLQQNQPALFIATPILKRYRQNPVMPNPPASMQQVYYIYGGYWKANMVSPPNISEPIYESTNQSPIGTSTDVDLEVDDYMFLRPTQSEFVMLQFGDLLVFKDGEISQRWPVFHQTG